MQQAHRWINIALPMTPNAFHLFFQAPTHPFPLLETIHVGDADDDTVGGISDAPKLREISFHYLSTVDKLLPLPFHQIQELSIASASGEACDLLLGVFSNLQTLIIGTSEQIYWHTLPPPQAREAVRKLVLRGDDARRHSAMDVLNVMNLPNLQELQLLDFANLDIPSVVSHVQRSGSQIATLCLRNTQIRGKDLLDLLRALPTVETLTMTKLIPNAITDTVLKALISAPHDTSHDTSQPTEIILPSLTKVVLDGTYLFSTDALLTMLESRLAAGNPCSALDVIDIALPNRLIGSCDLTRFANLRDARFSRLICLDGDKVPVWIRDGHWPR
ncbi:hypothetical protein DFH07DRAFT_288186 [Mycena maculata]|uniref:Uncharacterized protein n=1 Tax=Mycena maculata TaxID=230809 RepID=A0AAD7HLC3_9AGAR|nr:hypothetical protein DFH07DRAFT_288186 [Mycena maculata]